MKKVLVADDTKNIRNLLSKCLELENYEVKTASDGQEALNMLTEENFDLAFLDKKMPYLSGTEVLKHIREQGVRTHVIIITAYASVKNAVECTKMGAVAYLQKPFTAEKVRGVLAEIKESTVEKAVAEEVLKRGRKLIDEKNYPEAYAYLKGELGDFPLNENIYLLLSEVCEGLDYKEEARKFNKIYKSLK
jgi:two-component system, OmpR family, response regulator